MVVKSQIFCLKDLTGRSWAALVPNLGRSDKPVGSKPIQVLFQSQLFACGFTGHVSHTAENGSFGTPCPIVSPQNPENTVVRVGVSPIESVFVVQFDHHGQGLTRAFCPVQDLLSPQHSHVVVHHTGFNDLTLSSIPDRVCGLGVFEFCKRVKVRAFIACVFVKGLLGPVWQ